MYSDTELLLMPKATDVMILENTEKILRVLSVLATKGMKQRDQIALLNAAGLEPKNIAGLLGTSSNTVRVALVEIRRNRGKRKAKLKARDAGIS